MKRDLKKDTKSEEEHVEEEHVQKRNAIEMKRRNDLRRIRTGKTLKKEARARARRLVGYFEERRGGAGRYDIVDLRRDECPPEV